LSNVLFTQVRMTTGSDAETVQRAVEARLGGLRAELPAGVPLSQLVTVREESLPATIRRDASQRCVVLRVTAPTLPPKELVEPSRAQAQNLQLPAGVSVSWDATDD
jgi:multidrug efflux pump subunit AcrB